MYAANGTFPLAYNVVTLDNVKVPSSIISTGHECLLIPAAFLAWWYWTKRTTRRVVRGVLTYARGGTPTAIDCTSLGRSEDSICSNRADHASPIQAKSIDESQNSLFDLPENSLKDSSSPTFRFIRWLKGTKGSRIRHKVHVATRQNLRGPDLATSIPSPVSSEMSMDFGGSPQFSSTYEEIMAVELCSLEESSAPHPSSNPPGRLVCISVETVPDGEVV